MKKSRFFGVVFLCFVISLVLISTLASSANSTTNTSTNTADATTLPPALTNSESSSAITKGYSCLNDLIKNKTTLSLQEAIFGTLAVGTQTNLQNKITAEKSTESCWPKAGCTIKETAQVLLAQKRAGKSTADIEKWLLSKNVTSNDLNWFLEIDITNHVASECTLKYDGSEKKINIQEDMRVTGNPGNCFGIAQGGYWLLFRESCYDKEIQVTCNQDFISTLVYQKKAGDTIFVLPDTHSSAALGSTSEKVSVKCFKSGSACDYEGSLWAALSLYKAGRSVEPFVPYLIAMSENNQKYFPSAFLYALTGAEDQYSDIIQSQKQGRSWRIVGSQYGEFYDTSLAMLALSKSSAVELENTKNYLLGIQSKDGCWNNDNLRDTAFILYSGWSRAAATSGDGGGALCEAISTQSCENSVSCIDAGGKVLSNFECSGFNVCCSTKVQLASCSTKNGIVCSGSQTCDGNSVSALEGSCCVGTCVTKQIENTCEATNDKICRSTCLDNEEEDSSNTCSSGVCCIQKESSGSGSSVWIVILIILIILVILAIIFKSRLKLWWFKIKGKAKSSPIVKPGTPAQINSMGYKPQQIFRPTPSRGYARPSPLPPARSVRKNATSEKDKELEETLKKLRDMSN